MEHKLKKSNSELIKAGLMLGVGIVFFVAGLFTFNNPTFIPYLHLIQGIGLFLVVMGAWSLFQYWRYQKDPGAQKRARIEGTDERRLWIQYRSGNNAFKAGVSMTYLALLFAGATEKDLSSDLVWWVLAANVVVTLMVYAVSLIQYEKTC